MDHDIYMKQPPGFTDGTSRVCKLVKALYGCKQSPLLWYLKLGEILEAAGFQRGHCDWALYYIVDERGAVTCFSTWMTSFWSLILQRFGRSQWTPSKELSPPNSRPRLYATSVSMWPSTIGPEDLLSVEWSYCDTLVKKFKDLPVYLEHKPKLPPATPLSDRAFNDSGIINTSPPTGTITRLQVHCGLHHARLQPHQASLTFVISKLSTASHNPLAGHFSEAVRALEYLISTKDYGLHYKSEGTTPLEGWCDSSYGGDQTDRRGVEWLHFRFQRRGHLLVL